MSLISKPALTSKKAVGWILNVLIALSSVSLVVILVSRFTNLVPNTRASHSLAVGANVELSGKPFAQSDRSIVLAIAPGCHFCILSHSFHHQLSVVAMENHIPVIVLVPDQNGAEQFVGDMGIESPRIFRTNFSTMGVAGTPTLALVDRTAKITHYWLGQVSPKTEDEVIALIRNPPVAATQTLASSEPLPREISSALLPRDLGNRDTVVLDVREREAYTRAHRSETRNIPLDEIPLRLRHEISLSSTIIIDCSVIGPSLCDGSAFAIRKMGYSTPTLLDKGAFRDPACRP